jgi:hypothetical protein
MDEIGTLDFAGMCRSHSTIRFAAYLARRTVAENTGTERRKLDG